MSLHLKYRPANLDEVEGNSTTIKSLRATLAKSREDIPHAFLFTGPSGCGKTTLGRIVAEMLGAYGNDFAEMDSADFRGIDTIREMRSRLAFKPMDKNSECRAWLLDECHQLSKDAQSALLKALEDTPKHCYIMLATTEPDQLLKTIRNRCATFTVSLLADRQIVSLLKDICKAEKKKVPEDALKQIGRDCLGSARVAVVMLDSIIDMDKDDMLDAIDKAAEEATETILLCRLLMGKPRWEKVVAVIKKMEDEPETVRRKVLGYLNVVVMGTPKKMGTAYAVMDAFRDNFYDSGKAGLTLACWEAINE